MKLLLDDKLAPITTTIGFLDVDPSRAARALIDMLEPILRVRDISFTTSSVTGELEAVLLSLLPLNTVGARRYLFIPTRSKWTAVFGNNWGWGLDVNTLGRLTSKVDGIGVITSVVPDTVHKSFPLAKSRFGGLMFEVYEGQGVLNCFRSISLHREDLGKWEFEKYGQPFPFEDVQRYYNKRVSKRFSFELLEAYLHEFGLSPFDAAFYHADKDNPALLVELNGPNVASEAQVTLEEARWWEQVTDNPQQ